MWQKNMHHFVLARWWEQHKSWFLYRMLESDFTSSREASVAANDSSSSSPEFSYPCMKSPSYLSVSRQVLNLWLHGSWLIMIVISRFISFLSVCVCLQVRHASVWQLVQLFHAGLWTKRWKWCEPTRAIRLETTEIFPPLFWPGDVEGFIQIRYGLHGFLSWKHGHRLLLLTPPADLARYADGKWCPLVI